MKMKMKIRDLVYIALMAALCCVLGPWSIPIGLIPISLGLVGVYLAGYILGAFKGTIAVLIYILLGAVGVPVFTGFTGGIPKLIGPTGGYIIGYILVAFCTGYAADHADFTHLYKHVIGMFIGLICCYALGTIWVCVLASMELYEALKVCVIPFIPFDIMKIGLSTVVGVAVKRSLINAHLLEDPNKKKAF